MSNERKEMIKEAIRQAIANINLEEEFDIVGELQNNEIEEISNKVLSLRSGGLNNEVGRLFNRK
jgi:hypothetical protein